MGFGCAFLELEFLRLARMELVENLVEPADKLHVQIELVHREQGNQGNHEDRRKLFD